MFSTIESLILLDCSVRKSLSDIGMGTDDKNHRLKKTSPNAEKTKLKDKKHGIFVNNPVKQSGYLRTHGVINQMNTILLCKMDERLIEKSYPPRWFKQDLFAQVKTRLELLYQIDNLFRHFCRTYICLTISWG